MKASASHRNPSTPFSNQNDITSLKQKWTQVSTLFEKVEENILLLLVPVAQSDFEDSSPVAQHKIRESKILPYRHSRSMRMHCQTHWPEQNPYYDGFIGLQLYLTTNAAQRLPWNSKVSMLMPLATNLLTWYMSRTKRQVCVCVYDP